MHKSLALFDFDGTLTTRDSLIDFIIFAVGLKKTLFAAFCLAPILLSYKMNLIDNGRAKERVLSFLFKEWGTKKISEIGEKYAEERLPKILNENAIKKLEWHKSQGHEVVVVTASIEDWIKNWTNKLGVNLIATKLKKNGNLSLEFASKNCYGKEKVRRIKQCYNLESYNYIYAYGDTVGDKPMLLLADKASYKAFT